MVTHLLKIKGETIELSTAEASMVTHLLKIKGETIELSTAEAKQLLEDLKEIFGESGEPTLFAPRVPYSPPNGWLATIATAANS